MAALTVPDPGIGPTLLPKPKKKESEESFQRPYHLPVEPLAGHQFQHKSAASERLVLGAASIASQCAASGGAQKAWLDYFVERVRTLRDTPASQIRRECRSAVFAWRSHQTLYRDR